MRHSGVGVELRIKLLSQAGSVRPGIGGVVSQMRLDLLTVSLWLERLGCGVPDVDGTGSSTRWDRTWEWLVEVRVLAVELGDSGLSLGGGGGSSPVISTSLSESNGM